jgi:acetyl esterase
MKKLRVEKKRNVAFYRRKLFLWPVGIGVFILVVLLAFRISPWPGALIIRAVFTDNSQKVLKAMEKHVPKTPISVISNESYRANDDTAVLDVYSPKSATDKLPVIIWTHGGAWLSGDKANDAPYFKLLAEKGFAVVALNYALAPEAQYPTPVFQLNDAYGYLNVHAGRLKLDMSKVILAGDSAGSNLSAQMAALITNPSYAREVKITPALQPEQLKGVVLTCGIYKMEGLTQPDPALPKIVGWGDDVSVWAYSGTRDFSDAVIRQMSPYYYVTSNFPPTFITGGNNDPLTDAQSKPLADKLDALGVSVKKLFYASDHQPGLPHEYQFNLDTADGQNALEEITTSTKNHT